MLTLAQKAFIDIEGNTDSRGFEVWVHHSKQTVFGNGELFEFSDNSKLFRSVDGTVSISGGYENEGSV